MLQVQPGGSVHLRRRIRFGGSVRVEVWHKRKLRGPRHRPRSQPDRSSMQAHRLVYQEIFVNFFFAFQKLGLKCC